MDKNKKRLRLVLPSKKYLNSFAKGIDESRPENTQPLASHFRLFKTKKDFPAYMKKISDDRKGLNLEKGHVPQMIYWAMAESKFVGVLKLRHRLWPEKMASHIGYAVIPSERRKGYATEMLRLGLVKAKSLGIKNVVVGCDIDNMASRKVIENNKGVLSKKLRYAKRAKFMFNIDNK